jgi:non-haem Fe2+, alpha-ketoglutarate-dependent halogenase
VPGRLLTEEQRHRYELDGALFPLPILASEDVRRFRAHCDELESWLGGKPRTVDVRQLHLHFRWAYELASDQRVLDAVESLLGPDLLIWATELFAKHPHDSAISIAWHRDLPYLGFDGGVTAWIALSDSTLSNGCMKVRLEPDRHQASSQGNGKALKPTSHPQPEEILPIELRAGEMSLHDSYVLHGSDANLSPDKRVGFAVRFVSPAARPRSGRPPALVVRGVDRFDHFRLVDPLEEEPDVDEALAGLKRSAAEHLDAMLEGMKRLPPQSHLQPQ